MEMTNEEAAERLEKELNERLAIGMSAILCAAMCKGIESLKNKMKWIPCEEKMPEEYKTVLFVEKPNKSGCVFCNYYYHFGYWKDHHWHSENASARIENVVAWMEVPKYKEG